MDIRSLFEQTMSSAKNLFTFRAQKKFFTQTKYLLHGKEMSSKIGAIFLRTISFVKSIWLKVERAFSEAVSFFRHSYRNFGTMVRGSLSRLKGNSLHLGRFIFTLYGVLKVHSSRLINHFSMRRMQYGLFIGFFGVTAMLGFCVHTYFKNQSFDELENVPVIKSLALRLTQTESNLRDAQAQIQAMRSLEHEIKRTASRIGETEESLKPIKKIEERLTQAEHKVEEIDTIGGSLKLTGLKSLIGKNKQKKIKSLSGHSDDLDSVKEKIRKEVKRQMKVLEAGDNNSF